MRRVWLAAGALLALLALPMSGRTAAAVGVLDFSDEERASIAGHGPWPPSPEPDPAQAGFDRSAVVAFGRTLFFDRRLSADGRASCASCHVPALAFQDGRAVPRLRDGVATGVRNTPSLLDSAQRRWLGWGGEHDSLWAASLAPLLAAAEMGNRVDDLAARVRGTPELAKGHQRALGPLPASDEALLVNLAKALAAYQTTLRSPRTPFDDFRDALLRGDLQAAARYPLAAQRGLRLFLGEGRCGTCHAGPAFSNGEFADIGIPFFVPGGVDAGRHAGLKALLASPYNRLGPHGAAGDLRAVATRHVVVEHRHFGEFRVPTLRGLVPTAPYMHDGSLATLDDVVRHYSELDEERLHADGERILRPLKLQPAAHADLLAFLRSLSP